MKQRWPWYLLAFVLVCTIGVMVWAILFYYQNLRGAKPAVTPPPYDIADVIEGQNEQKDGNDAVPEGKNISGIPLTIPPGFSIKIFAKDVPGARVIAFDFFDTMYVSQKRGGIVARVRTENGVAAEQEPLFPGLNSPHGLTRGCIPDTDACFLYIAQEDQIRRFVFTLDGGILSESPQDIVALPQGGRHDTRTIAFGPDGRLYVSIGSSCDVCEEENPLHGTIQVVDMENKKLIPYATGLRNAVFFTWHPKTGEMWSTEMGRDRLGDNLPPDEINIVKEGGWYGWPWFYGKNVFDEQFRPGVMPGFAKEAVPSHIDLPAHVAPLGLAFIPEDSGWPEEYWNDLLVAYHGSWNRTEPVGYKIARFDLDEDGNVLGSEDFISGWLTGDNRALGRPVDLKFHNGALYVSDDHAGVIYKVTYGEGTPAQASGAAGAESGTADVFYDPNYDEKKDIIEITSMKPNNLLALNGFVEGRARDWWYEWEDGSGHFLAAIADANGEIFAHFDGLAIEEKPTNGDSWVRFRFPVVIELPQTNTGFLILDRDISGEIVGGFTQQMVFPVRFR